MRKMILFLVVVGLVLLVVVGLKLNSPAPVPTIQKFSPRPAMRVPPVRTVPKATLATDKVTKVVSPEEALANKHGLSWDDGVVPINVSR